MNLIGFKREPVEVSISGCGVAAGFLATAQPPFSHKYRRPQAKEYPSGLQPLTAIVTACVRRRIVRECGDCEDGEYSKDIKSSESSEDCGISIAA
jgi:hypothetical protein